MNKQIPLQRSPLGTNKLVIAGGILLVFVFGVLANEHAERRGAYVDPRFFVFTFVTSPRIYFVSFKTTPLSFSHPQSHPVVYSL